MREQPDEADRAGTADAELEHPLVRAARRLGADLLEPRAAEVDTSAVPRSHLDALGTAGLLGLAGQPEQVARAVTEVLAGADLSTWLVQAQHHGPLRRLVAHGGFESLVTDLSSGRLVAGVAFSHLRRWPRRPVRAERTARGWRLDGMAPWYTGWGLNDVMLLSGVDPDGTVVHCMVGAEACRGLEPTAPLEVTVCRAARTVGLGIRGLQVDCADVVVEQPIEEWAKADALHTANASPAVFGLAGSALALLHRHGAEREDPAATAAAVRIGDKLDEVREATYRMLDHVAAQENISGRLELRARSLAVLVEATTALVVAGAGSSLLTGAPAQRKAREALFLLVQAQTVPSRRAMLDLWGR